MTDITASASKIQQEATIYNSPDSEGLMTQMGANINYLLNMIHPVGSYLYAALTEAQLQSQMGSGWVLADGRSVTGSRYATITGNSTVPDHRGVFPRAKNYTRADTYQNFDGDTNLNQLILGHLGGHSHSSVSHTHKYGYPSGINDDTGPANTSSGSMITETVPGDNSPTYITVNAFIRIN